VAKTFMAGRAGISDWTDSPVQAGFEVRIAPPRDWAWSEDNKRLLSYDIEIVGADSLIVITGCCATESNQIGGPCE
jgi:hypothetical protein